eukprot:CAMPEP_0119048340 /NCGR_PEP_ID=MMETSP1177-20130426/58370_1 /TAXON_ID=2985 /ORGANISM="Ochromonas sp, Strain CCMP1899" /LENGTH=134 /DNA_ID=CAMNT_0007024077 /DNA_START=570 /DNA_END=974 /DNA_ORIENTATION=-
MVFGYPCFYGESSFMIYKSITDGIINYPPQKNISLPCHDIIQGLCTNDRSLRLGCGKEGFQGVKKHPFFKGTDWNSAARELIEPPVAPYVGDEEGDTSNYDYYPEDDAEDVNKLTLNERIQFQELQNLLGRQKN